MAVNYARLGDGTLSVGVTPLDISSQVVGCRLVSEVDTGDTLTMLSGEQIASGMTTSSTLEGSLVLDPNTGGIGEFSWTNHGQSVPFVFTPNTAAGLVITGTLTITRLDIGADEYGALLQPEFAWVASVETDGVVWGSAA